MSGEGRKEGGGGERELRVFGFRPLLFLEEGSRFVKDYKESTKMRLTIDWSCIDVAEEEGEKMMWSAGGRKAVDLFKVTHPKTGRPSGAQKRMRKNLHIQQDNSRC